MIIFLCFIDYCPFFVLQTFRAPCIIASWDSLTVLSQTIQICLTLPGSAALKQKTKTHYGNAFVMPSAFPRKRNKTCSATRRNHLIHFNQMLPETKLKTRKPGNKFLSKPAPKLNGNTNTMRENLFSFPLSLCSVALNASIISILDVAAKIAKSPLYVCHWINFKL